MSVIAECDRCFFQSATSTKSKANLVRQILQSATYKVLENKELRLNLRQRRKTYLLLLGV